MTLTFFTGLNLFDILKGDCSCSDSIFMGFGACKPYVRNGNEGPMCFVNLPSTCKDKHLFLNMNNKYISWEACKGNIEKQSMNECLLRKVSSN